MVASRCLCGSCERALQASDLHEDEFVQRYRPSPAHRHLTGESCVVHRDGVRCERRQESNQTGLCHAHTSRWNRTRDRLGLSREEWCAGVARPLPPRPACTVAGCPADARVDVGLCGGHFRVWRLGQAALGIERREEAEAWAARQPQRLRANEFSLAALAPTVRVEVLFALQQRDAQGQRIDPLAGRGLVRALAGLDALATTALRERRERVGRPGIANAYGRMAWRIIDLTFEEFGGVSHTKRDTWDALALDLETPRPERRPNRAVIDFTSISQEWLRAATKHWVVTVRPATGEVKRAVQVATLASLALSRRPGGGQQVAGVGFAEVTAAYEAIKGATRADGRLYDSHYRRGLWARFWAIIDLGRASGLLEELPGSFVRQRSLQRIVAEEANEDQIGKAVPETVIAQLDAQLDLLEAAHPYGRVWPVADTSAMFCTAYVILRDTGRRPGEVVSLSADCVEVDGGEHALVYDNHKKHRLRRRLPITAETAAMIGAWQARRATLLLPASAQKWLFPAPQRVLRAGAPHHDPALHGAAALRGGDPGAFERPARAGRHAASLRPLGDLPLRLPPLLRAAARGRRGERGDPEGADGPQGSLGHPGLLHQPSEIASDGCKSPGGLIRAFPK